MGCATSKDAVAPCCGPRPPPVADKRAVCAEPSSVAISPSSAHAREPSSRHLNIGLSLPPPRARTLKAYPSSSKALVPVEFANATVSGSQRDVQVPSGSAWRALPSEPTVSTRSLVIGIGSPGPVVSLVSSPPRVERPASCSRSISHATHSEFPAGSGRGLDDARLSTSAFLAAALEMRANQSAPSGSFHSEGLAGPGFGGDAADMTCECDV